MRNNTLKDYLSLRNKESNSQKETGQRRVFLAVIMYTISDDALRGQLKQLLEKLGYENINQSAYGVTHHYYSSSSLIESIKREILKNIESFDTKNKKGDFVSILLNPFVLKSDEINNIVEVFIFGKREPADR